MLVPFRLKSASMPWPMASWSRMPEEPAASTTGSSPAGAGPASKRMAVRATAWSHHPVQPLRRVELEAGPAGHVVAVLLAPAVLLGQHRERASTVMGWRSSAMRPVESATSTAPASERRWTVTFLTRGSAAKARWLSAWRSGSRSSGRTASQGRPTG